MSSLDTGFFLNGAKLNTMNDSAQGGVAGLGGVPGRLGALKYFSDAEAAQSSDSSVTGGVCRNGLYMIVQAKSTSTITPIRGGLCVFSDIANSIVTPDLVATNEGGPTFVYCGTPTKGNYCVVQVAGLAKVKYRATVTSKVDGNLVVQLTTTSTADAIAAATGTFISGGVLGLKNIIGNAAETPEDAGLNLVWLLNRYGFQPS